LHWRRLRRVHRGTDGEGFDDNLPILITRADGSSDDFVERLMVAGVGESLILGERALGGGPGVFE